MPTSLSDHGKDPYAAARHDMIESQLRRRGIVMHNVLEAMRDVPRHLFVPHAHAGNAYADEALPSMEGQTISQPFMVAIMTQELALKPGLRVLEIGTGTGYQTAILAHLVGATGTVCSIERVPALADSARRRLAAMSYQNIRIQVGDGSQGWPRDERNTEPKFDRILITAGAPSVPQPLITQLADEGILVAPIGDENSQTLIRMNRRGEVLEETRLFACRFVPLVGANGWTE